MVSYNDENAFSESLIIEGINQVSSLFDPEVKLIFLADRWFTSVNILKCIDSLGHTFCIRAKKSITVKMNDENGKEIEQTAGDITSYKYHSNLIENVKYTKEEYVLNIAISKYEKVETPWIIITNGNVRQAIKDYSYRFSSIECMFKNQKSNGFNIEAINNATLKSFSTMYSLVYFSVTFMVIIEADYSKNTKCYKNVKIETHKRYKEKGKIREVSLFKIGLMLFTRAINSSLYI